MSRGDAVGWHSDSGHPPLLLAMGYLARGVPGATQDSHTLILQHLFQNGFA